MIKQIYQDIRNNDYRSLEEYLYKKFDSEKRIDGQYVGKTTVDFRFYHIVNNRYDVLKRAVDILRQSAEKKYGIGVKVIPCVMDELLPDRLGIELWCYK